MVRSSDLQVCVIFLEDSRGITQCKYIQASPARGGCFGSELTMVPLREWLPAIFCGCLFCENPGVWGFRSELLPPWNL